MATRAAFNEFFDGYVEAALWSSTDDDGEPLDANYSRDDIDTKSLREWKKDCVSFMRFEKKDLVEFQKKTGHGWGSCGHDFWLTRNGHGAGFWDRGAGAVGERLSKATKPYGSVDLYVHDGKVYGS